MGPSAAVMVVAVEVDVMLQVVMVAPAGPVVLWGMQRIGW